MLRCVEHGVERMLVMFQHQLDKTTFRELPTPRNPDDKSCRNRTTSGEGQGIQMRVSLPITVVTRALLAGPQFVC
jgi:hypothetical protein